MTDRGKVDAQFVLIVQDVGGNVEVAGVQEPEAFDGTRASHIFAKWIQAHIDECLRAALAEHKAEETDYKLFSPPDRSVIGPDRERTIILPEGAADAA